MAGPTLTGLLAEAAATAPDAPALIEPGRVTNFGALEDMARRLAAGLVDLGVGKGDRVALWLPNVPGHYALHFAVWRLGATVVGVNTRFRAKEVEDIVGRSGAKVLAYWPGFKDIDFAGILSEIDGSALGRLERILVYDGDDADAPVPASVLGRPVVRYSELLRREPMAADRARPETPAQIFTTSGTTSKPKFVLHAHASIARHAPVAARAWGVAEPDAVLFQAAPLCGVVGLLVAAIGVAAVRPQIVQTLFDAAEAAELIREHRVTQMIATDEMWERMLAAREEERPFPSLCACPSFGANPPLARYLDLVERRGLPAINAYGMSECLALFALQPVDDPVEVRTMGGGFPLAPESGVRVRDPETGRPCAAGEAGEIEVSGPTLMLGYADDPAVNARAWTEDGWLRTGDLGTMEPDGRMTYLSRMGDMLRLAGFLVSPAEIEAELERDQSVLQAQVVGIHTARGQKAFAFVRLVPGAVLDEAGLRARCRARLADYKAPVRVAALDAFPVTESPNAVKIQRHRLRALAQETWDAEQVTAAE